MTAHILFGEISLSAVEDDVFKKGKGQNKLKISLNCIFLMYYMLHHVL